MATAGDQIKRALRLLGVLAEGEEPSAAEYADSVVALNQMLDSWSTERLSVYGTTDATHTWPAGQASQIIGPEGDFVTTVCPLRIDDSTYYVFNGISQEITLINEAQYNAIPLKTNTSTLPQVMWPEMMNVVTTNIRMTLYPVPSQDLEFHIISVRELAQVADETTTLYFPAGYLRAFAYNLAMELAPEFGVEPSAQVKRGASSSKRNIKRINNPGDLMSMPPALIGSPRYNVYLGY